MTPKDDDFGFPEPDVPDTELFAGIQPRFKAPPPVLTPVKELMPVLTAKQFMDRSGQTMKRGVNLADVNPEMVNGMKDARRLLDSVGISQVYTAGLRNWGVRSHHETGNAVDLRLRPSHASPEKVQKLRDLLNAEASGSAILIRGKPATLWRRGEYEFMIHGKGNGIHLHIERDTPETQAQLNTLMETRKTEKNRKEYEADLQARYEDFTTPTRNNAMLAGKLKAEREAEQRMARK
jgi:hypothetical protein